MESILISSEYKEKYSNTPVISEIEINITTVYLLAFGGEFH